MSVQIDTTIIGALAGTKIVSGILVPNSGCGILLDNGLVVDVRGNRVLSDVESNEVVLVAKRRLRRQRAELQGLDALGAVPIPAPAAGKPKNDEPKVLPFMPADEPIESDVTQVHQFQDEDTQPVVTVEVAPPPRKLAKIDDLEDKDFDADSFLANYNPTGELGGRDLPNPGAEFSDLPTRWGERHEKEEGRD